MAHNPDILVDIPNDSLPKLASFYQKNAQWAPYMYAFIQNAMKWKKSDKFKNLIHLWSPEDSWEQDGTVIILSEIYSQDIYAFTLEDSCKKLYRGLSETKRINFNSGRSIFYGIHEKHLHIVYKIIEEKGLGIVEEIPAVLVALPPDAGKKFTLECSPEVSIKKLKPSDAETISKVYPHPFANHDKYTGSLIEIHGGYGVFLNSTNTMVAWFLRHVFGLMTMLQTDGKHKRKGYASLVTKALAKEVGEEGFWAISTVMPHNEAAIKMFESLGFRIIGAANYITVA